MLPTIKCNGCGHSTNSACSNYWDDNAMKMSADRCYARWNEEESKWEKGCGFVKASAFDKAFAMTLITGKSLSETIQEV